MPPPPPTWATSTPAMMEALPFEEHINRHQPLPTGERVFDVHDFDVRDFGASPEKYLLSTEAFAAAAWACEAAGGGTILLVGGSYWSGTVSIPSDYHALYRRGRGDRGLLQYGHDDPPRRGAQRPRRQLLCGRGGPAEHHHYRRRTHLRQRRMVCLRASGEAQPGALPHHRAAPPGLPGAAAGASM